VSKYLECIRQIYIQRADEQQKSNVATDALTKFDHENTKMVNGIIINLISLTGY